MAQQRAVVVVDAEDTPFCATGADLVADRLFSLGASAVSETRTPARTKRFMSGGFGARGGG